MDDFPTGRGPFDGLSGPSAWDGMIQTLFNLLARLWGFVISIAQYFWALISNLVNVLINVFRRLGAFLRHVWEQYVKAAIDWLSKHVHKVIDWLRRHVATVIKHLQRWKKWYDDHILKQQLRMLQTIQRIRQYLAVLRLFHVKFAVALDAKLADIQNRIEQSISVVRGTFNQIINLLSAVFDPSLLFRRNALGASLLANVGLLKRITDFGSSRPLFASEQATINHDLALSFKSTTQAHVSTLAQSGLTTQDRANDAAARQALIEATGAPLPF